MNFQCGKTGEAVEEAKVPTAHSAAKRAKLWKGLLLRSFLFSSIGRILVLRNGQYETEVRIGNYSTKHIAWDLCQTF